MPPWKMLPWLILLARPRFLVFNKTLIVSPSQITKKITHIFFATLPHYVYGMSCGRKKHIKKALTLIFNIAFVFVLTTLTSSGVAFIQGNEIYIQDVQTFQELLVLLVSFIGIIRQWQESSYSLRQVQPLFLFTGNDDNIFSCKSAFFNFPEWREMRVNKCTDLFLVSVISKVGNNIQSRSNPSPDDKVISISRILASDWNYFLQAKLLLLIVTK